MSSSHSGSCVICGQSNLHTLSACQNCGARLPWVNANALSQNTSPLPAKESLANVWLQIASFFVPLLGIALYFAYRTNNPKRAISAIRAAALGVALNLVILLTAK